MSGNEAAEVRRAVAMSDEHMQQMRSIRAQVLEASRRPLSEEDREHPDFAEFARGSLIFAFNRLAGDDGLTAHVRTEETP